jgi:hypothetical protein
MGMLLKPLLLAQPLDQK